MTTNASEKLSNFVVVRSSARRCRRRSAFVCGRRSSFSLPSVVSGPASRILTSVSVPFPSKLLPPGQVVTSGPDSSPRVVLHNGRSAPSHRRHVTSWVSPSMVGCGYYEAPNRCGTYTPAAEDLSLSHSCRLARVPLAVGCDVARVGVYRRAAQVSSSCQSSRDPI